MALSPISALGFFLLFAATLAAGAAPSSQPGTRPSASITLPLITSRGTPHVRATVNGQTGLFVVDTGSSQTHIYRDVIAKWGLHAIASKSVNTFEGIKKTDLIVLNELLLGSIRIRSMPAFIAASDSYKLKADQTLGVLGMDVLGRQPFAIDFRKKTLTLYEPETFVPPASKAYALRANVDDPRILAAVQGHEGWFQIDTGYDDTVLLSQAFAEQFQDLVFDRPQVHLHAVWADKTDSYGTRWDSSDIFGEHLREENGGYDVAGRFGSHSAGLIGTVHFRESILTIDMASRRAWREILPPEDLDTLLHRLKGKNDRDISEPSPLQGATSLKRLDAVKALLDGGESPNDTDIFRVTPLMVAAARGLPEMVDLLLKNGAKVDATSRYGGYSAEHFAARFGRLGTLDRLITGGADVNQAADWGKTPLFLAAEAGHIELVKLLLDHGAKVDAPLVTGETPLLAASNNGDAALVKLLLEHKADANGVGAGGTCLTYACYSASPACVKLLLAYGANPTRRGSKGTLPLMAAAWIGSRDAAECIRLLLRAGADPTVKTEPSEAFPNGRTALEMAIERGHVESIMLLLPPSAIRSATQPVKP
jgi:ankyrin repeat protein